MINQIPFISLSIYLLVGFILGNYSYKIIAEDDSDLDNEQKFIRDIIGSSKKSRSVFILSASFLWLPVIITTYLNHISER